MHALSLGAGAPAHNVTSLLCRRRQRSRAGGGFRVHARASSDTTPHVVVIGAGWGGWGAAKALSGAGVRVTLLDAARDPTGKTPFKTPTGKPFEAGTRGFWKDYPNIYDLVRELGLAESDVFTLYTTSAFWSPDGLEATAPVFADAPVQLPSPMGQVLASMENFKRIPIADRATMAGLLLAILDFEKDNKTYLDYDRMTAHELCIRAGLSKRLVDDFVRPTLAVGLFAPLELTSAAVMLELLYFYALAHQDSFDVRWISKRSIAELIIAPLASRLAERYGVDIRGGCRVDGLDLSADGRRVSAVRYTEGGEQKAIADVDGVVLAVGAKGLRAIASGSPALARAAPELASAAALGTIDVISTRLWLDRVVPAPHPANVFSRFDELRGAGGTYFMLDQLQCGGPGATPEEREAGLRELWGLGPAAPGDAPAQLGSVVAADFYFSGALSFLPDDAIVALLSERLLPATVPEFAGAKVVDSFVLRCPGAVSWFSPGSFPSRPPLQTGLPNVVCAGDWVKMGDREHGAKGLCQERAYVSGLEAGNALLRSGALQGSTAVAAWGGAQAGGGAGEHPVLPIRPDEPQVVAGKQAAKAAAAIIGAAFSFPSRILRSVVG